ncbi:hypothetical protein ACSSS7_004462 [Eimeria intestinalis]
MNARAADTLRAAARCLPKAAVRRPPANAWSLGGNVSKQRLQSATEFSLPAFARASNSFQLDAKKNSCSSCSSSSSNSSSNSSSSSSSSSSGGNRIRLWCSVASTRILRKAFPLQEVYARAPSGGPPYRVWLSFRSLSEPLPRVTAHAATSIKKQQQQQQQQLAAAGRCELPLAYPDDYASDDAYPSKAAGSESSSSSIRNSTSSSNSSSSSSSSSNEGAEALGMLPAWARRLQPPKREVIFMRVLPVAPLLQHLLLLLQALGAAAVATAAASAAAAAALPTAAAAAGVKRMSFAALGFESLARSCLSALIAYSATLLTANAAVHAGMQLSELGFPAERQHRGFYTVGRLGVSLFFVVHSLLVCGLLHEEPLNGIYLCIASSLAMLGVDWLLYKKMTTPLWFFAERKRMCLWMVAGELRSA